MSNIQYERHTKAQITPTLTTVQLASALLNPAEIERWTGNNNRMIVDGKILGLGGTGANLLLPHLKEESIISGRIKFETNPSFQWSGAVRDIQKRFGLTGFHTIGTRTKISGIIVSSLVTISDPDEQVKKYANVIRSIKMKYPDRHFQLEECNQTMACDPKLTALLKKLLEEKQPKSSLYPERTNEAS